MNIFGSMSAGGWIVWSMLSFLIGLVTIMLMALFPSRSVTIPFPQGMKRLRVGDGAEVLGEATFHIYAHDQFLLDVSGEQISPEKSIGEGLRSVTVSMKTAMRLTVIQGQIELLIDRPQHTFEALYIDRDMRNLLPAKGAMLMIGIICIAFLFVLLSILL